MSARGGPRAGARHGGGGRSCVETAAEIGGGGRSRGKFARPGGPGARAYARGRREQGLKRVPAEPGRGPRLQAEPAAGGAGGGTLAPFSPAGPPPPARPRPPQPAPAWRASLGPGPSVRRRRPIPLAGPSPPPPPARRPLPPAAAAPCARSSPPGPSRRPLAPGSPVSLLALLRQCSLRPRPEGDLRVGGGGPACGEASLGLRLGAGAAWCLPCALRVQPVSGLLTHGGCSEPLRFSQLCPPALVTRVSRWASELLRPCPQLGGVSPPSWVPQLPARLSLQVKGFSVLDQLVSIPNHPHHVSLVITFKDKETALRFFLKFYVFCRVPLLHAHSGRL